MRKFLTGLFICAGLFFVTGCVEEDDTDITDGINQTTTPIGEEDEESALNLSNFRLVTEYVNEKLYVSVDVEMNFDDIIPTYEFTLVDSQGNIVLEELNNDENVELSSCKLNLSNTNLELNSTVKCNSMFEVSGDGVYTIKVMNAEELVKEVVFEVKNDQVILDQE